MPPEGTPRKDPVVPQVGGGVDPPPHPPMSRWERLLFDVFLPGGVVLVALCLSAAAVVIIGKWLGGAAVGTLAALLVVVAGVLLARSSISAELERTIVDDARERGAPMLRREAQARARAVARFMGCAVALAGGVGLAIAFAAL